MSHLNHKIPWHDLRSSLEFDTTEIRLPVGECGRIHLIDKATKMKVTNRKFIKENDICTSEDCKTEVELGSFSKNKKSRPVIEEFSRFRRSSNKAAQLKLKYFKDKFWETINEFVSTLDEKYTIEAIKAYKPPKEIEVLDIECCYCYGQPCRCHPESGSFTMFNLFATDQIEHLLWLDLNKKLSISKELDHAVTQAIGNRYSFLISCHLLTFYLVVNLIAACGYEENEEEWGPLRPNGYFRRSIMDDCDFYTFMPNLRSYLCEPFLKDATKNKELLKKVFRYIYVYVFLMKRFGKEERCIDDFDGVIGRYV